MRIDTNFFSKGFSFIFLFCERFGYKKGKGNKQQGKLFSSSIMPMGMVQVD